VTRDSATEAGISLLSSKSPTTASANVVVGEASVVPIVSVSPNGLEDERAKHVMVMCPKNPATKRDQGIFALLKGVKPKHLHFARNAQFMFVRTSVEDILVQRGGCVGQSTYRQLGMQDQLKTHQMLFEGKKSLDIPRKRVGGQH